MMYKTILFGLTGGAITGLICKYFLRRQQIITTEVDPLQENIMIPDDGNLYRMALVVNNELKMSSGKVMAQCSHAALGVFEEYASTNIDNFERWEQQGKSMIIYKVNDSETLKSLQKIASQQNLPTCLVQDAGRTQIARGSRTVLAIGPDKVEKIQNIVGYLPLY